MTRPATEILVHIAAASRAADDDRYRALAQAYAEFAPARRLDLGSVASSGTGGSESFGPERQPGGSIPLASSAQPLKFPSLSFDSVWDNVQSPGVVRRSQGRQQHYISPADCIPDSQPGNGLAAKDSRMAVVDHIDLVGGEDDTTKDGRGPARRAARKAASPDLSVLAVPQPSLAHDDTPQPLLPRQPLSQLSGNSQQSSQQSLVQADDEPAKGGLPHGWEVVPSSGAMRQPETDLAPHPSERDDGIPSSLPEESGRVVIYVEDSFCQAQDSSPLKLLPAGWGSATLKRRRPSDGTEPPDHRAKRPEVIDLTGGVDLCTHEGVKSHMEPRRKAQPPTRLNLSSLLTTSPVAPRSDNSLRVLPPEVRAAHDNLDPALLITEKLARLAERLDLGSRYSALVAHRRGGRVVQPFERGYWRLDTSGWPAERRRQAWAFLADYVERGDAGWSVWCTRDPVPHTWLRLYCFGATAGHIYLLLYTASDREILRTGAVWVDGSGTPTISMPPRKKQKQKRL